MHQTVQLAKHRRPSRSVTSATLVMALVVLACGEDGGAVSDADQEGAVEASVTADDGADTAEAADDSGEPDRSEEAPESDPGAATALTGADGWSDLHDLDIPEPGRAVFEFDGSRFDLEASCPAPGEIPDDLMAGTEPLLETLPFRLILTANGQSEDGRNVRLIIRREIYLQGDVFNRMRDAGWGGDGQLDVVVVQGLGRTSAILESPSSDDPDGALLPVVRASPEGEITVQGELAREFADETDVPEGPFTFAGRCQETWPQDALDSYADS